MHRGPRTRPAALLLAGALGLLGLASCGGDGPAAGGEEDPPPSAAAAEVGRYVALGDSFTAAPLVPTTEQETGCLRSTGNYPHLLADALDVGELVDVSCGGADATAMIGRQETPAGSVAPQFDALTPETDLVTLGLGGNDFGIFGTLVQRCPAVASRDPRGSPCRADQREGGEDELLATLPGLRERIASVLAGIEQRAPRAHVLVVGYPQLAPAQGRCEALPIAAGDYAYLREVTSGLNDALRDAAEGAGATYVDVAAASAGHDICSDDPWVNGRTTDREAALAYHPFAAEQRAVARLVRQALAGTAGTADTAA